MIENLYSDAHPESWYALVRSDAVSRGAIRAVEALGLDLAVFRTKRGHLSVVERHCPHMGASLAGGRVEGEFVECPFHGWRFGADGRCVEIPFHDGARIPARARVTTWPVCERFGWVWMYAGGPPSHALPPDDALTAGVARRATIWQRSFDLECHPLLVLENAADLRHGARVHGVPAGEHRADLLEEHAHELTLEVRYRSRLPVLGEIENRVETRYLGASSLIGRWAVNDRELGRFLVCPLPVAPRRTRLQMSVVAMPLPGALRVLGGLGRAIVARLLLRGVPEDHAIWRDMNPQRRSVLVSDDRLQQRYRRFYARHLPRDRSASPVAPADRPDRTERTERDVA